jgi:L-xylulokinase
MRGWHDRGHSLRAVMEGVVFNYRTHVDALRNAFEISEGRLTGGVTNSGRWVQMYSDGCRRAIAAASESRKRGGRRFQGLARR